MSVEGEPAARAPLKDLWQLERLPGVQFEQSACQPARAAG
jgi:predicted lipid-binding transport protein (Tim44 family)